MSESHPSAPTLKKGRSKYRLRQLLDCWPLLIWLAVFAAAIAGYSRGIVFERMNGVVDVYQESIAPTEDGTFKELGPGIMTGALVEKGQLVALMDDTMINLEISRFTERKKVRSLGNAEKAHERLVDLKGVHWDAKRKLAEDDETIKMLEEQLANRSINAFLETKAKIQLDLRLLNAKRVVRSKYVDDLEKDIETRVQILEEMRNRESGDIPMDAEDQQQFAMLEERRKRTELRAKHSGKIDRIGKEPGEFTRAGEFIVKVVAEPTQILGFLPQDEVNALAPGDDVWITSSVDRRTTFKSKIKDLSPRIDSVSDAASPLPNQKVRGRAVLIDYPVGSGLLPGQTVIIHLKPPGQIPLLRRMFGL